MEKLFVIAHTHWDFEWYFTRQEARVQFAFHMDEVFSALANNDLDYYLLDGQMSIVNDYLSTCPNKVECFKRFVKQGRLFIGPWYTQIDEMVTSGESVIRNLRLGIQSADKYGGAMRVGYLPDSFGQSQDMPKIYTGFNIHNAVFWRGLPIEQQQKFFNWKSNDGSKVLVTYLKNGYSTGVALMSDNISEKISSLLTQDHGQGITIVPVGSDQRPVELKLKNKISYINHKHKSDLIVRESNYPQLFRNLAGHSAELPTLSGEFIDPSTSKIHRGIYSSRYDLKQIYDELERIMTYVVEPLCMIASYHGISNKQGIIDQIWTTVAMGQAHDSSGGCNSDETNRDIYQRAVNALQTANSLRDYLLRKLSVSLDGAMDNNSLIVWNPLPFEVNEPRKFEISTTSPYFDILDENGNVIEFDILKQQHINAAKLKYDPIDMDQQWYYLTKIAFITHASATDWTQYSIHNVVKKKENTPVVQPINEIKNKYYHIKFENGMLHLWSLKTDKYYHDFLHVQESGDEGDTYDYSQPHHDQVQELYFMNASLAIQQGQIESSIILKGTWQVAKNLQERDIGEKTAIIRYTLKLGLFKDSDVIHFALEVDNQAFDHRMRLILSGPHKVNEFSYADTQFGFIARPIADPHLQDWKKVAYHEEPTSLRPMIHFANIHSKNESLTFLTKGSKDFQIIGDNFNKLAITLFRSVGYLGRPDLIRRPGKASGLINRLTATPDSQLIRKISFKGGIILESNFNPQKAQRDYLGLTQEKLYYQNQKLNQYTTPIQFFRLNRLTKALTHIPILNITQCTVVFSSLSKTLDQSGFELRFYNPTNIDIKKAGQINFSSPCNICLSDLEGKNICSIATGINQFKMSDFKAGEIRTYSIFPMKSE